MNTVLTICVTSVAVVVLLLVGLLTFAGRDTAVLVSLFNLLLSTGAAMLSGRAVYNTNGRLDSRIHDILDERGVGAKPGKEVSTDG